jgi:glycosyltransferase involved in cell wall biosynthesis
MLIEWLRRAVADHALRLRIYSSPHDQLLRECAAAGLTRPIVRYPSKASPLRDFCITWRLLGEVRSNVPILFAPGVLQASLAQWLAALLRGRKVVGYVPMAYSSRRMQFRGGAVRDWLVRKVVRRVDVWITISDQQRDLLVERWGVKRPVFVVTNRPAVLAEPPGRPGQFMSAETASRPVRVLFAGRFDANQKGLDWLCTQLRARAPQWRGKFRFTFMGEGEFRAALYHLASELGHPHVTVRPWGDVRSAMSDADLLLLPSRFEGLPLVALEATHFGLPVIASRQAGVIDLMPPACLFDFGDDAGLWSALANCEQPSSRAAALGYSRDRLRTMLSAASFRQEVKRIVSALEGMSRRGPWASMP